MKEPAVDWESARTIIRNACRALAAAKRSAPVFLRDTDEFERDCSVLLHDATQIFCDAIDELRGEPLCMTWSPELPHHLLRHPELCDETLARWESGIAEETSELLCATV